MKTPNEDYIIEECTINCIPLIAFFIAALLAILISVTVIGHDTKNKLELLLERQEILIEKLK